jgi:hypothetical protein
MPAIRREGRREIGSCLDCGAVVEAEMRRQAPTRIVRHECLARGCAFMSCSVTDRQDRMVRLDGAWYCTRHALVLVSKQLVSLYRAEGTADWSSICELIAETLPAIIERDEDQDLKSIE